MVLDLHQRPWGHHRGRKAWPRSRGLPADHAQDQAPRYPQAPLNTRRRPHGIPTAPPPRHHPRFRFWWPGARWRREAPPPPPIDDPLALALTSATAQSAEDDEPHATPAEMAGRTDRPLSSLPPSPTIRPSTPTPSTLARPPQSTPPTSPPPSHLPSSPCRSPSPRLRPRHPPPPPPSQLTPCPRPRSPCQCQPLLPQPP